MCVVDPSKSCFDQSYDKLITVAWRWSWESCLMLHSFHMQFSVLHMYLHEALLIDHVLSVTL